MDKSADTLNPAKTALIAELRLLSLECGAPDWDGQNAMPLNEAAKERAELFIRLWPEDRTLPEVAPSNDGCIELDFIWARGHMFSMTVGPAPMRVSYAWLDGAEKGHGCEVFDDRTIPPALLEIFDRLDH